MARAGPGNEALAQSPETHSPRQDTPNTSGAVEIRAFSLDHGRIQASDRGKPGLPMVGKTDLHGHSGWATCRVVPCPTDTLPRQAIANERPATCANDHLQTHC